MLDLDLQNKIRRGEIDPNNQSHFFHEVYKGLLWELNKSLSLRDKHIPHIILNTGDDTMYLEAKGQDQSISPLQQTNEDYVYNEIPRATITVGNIEVLADQLTSPYTNGNFEIEYDDCLYGFSGEFRRIPIKTSLTAKYYFDSFTDALEVSQQIISKMMFIKNYNISYLGQNVFCTYSLPSTIDKDIKIEFDGGTTDSKYKTFEIEYSIETNYPVFEPQTAILNSNIIRTTVGTIDTKYSDIDTRSSNHDEDVYDKILNDLIRQMDTAKLSLNKIISFNLGNTKDKLNEQISEVDRLFGEIETKIKSING